MMIDFYNQVLCFTYLVLLLAIQTMAPSGTQIDSFELMVDVYNNYFAQKSPVNVIERWRKVYPALGKGASGEVWHVMEDKGAGRSRALKIVKNSKKLGLAEIESLITLNEVGVFPTWVVGGAEG